MFDSKPYTFSTGEHRDRRVIFINFPYNYTLQQQVKALTGATWSQTHKAWYVQDNAFFRTLFNLSEPEIKISTRLQSKISADNALEVEKLIQQLQLQGYSKNTIRCYVSEFVQYIQHINPNPVKVSTTEDLKNYLLHCINILQLKENTLHSRINGLKFYFEQVLRQPKIFLEIPRPKKQLKLPKSLSTLEIKRIFTVTSNLKHNTMLKLCYGMGLRLSEIINIQISDIDSATMQVHIQRGKGKKDRYVNLPESILDQLRKYYKEYKPKEYLFEGQYGGQYSARSIQQVFKESVNKAKILKKIGIHSLRHSYATHLLENGTDIRFIQELLGHNDIKTTFVYTHVTDKSIRKIVSPLDQL